MTHYVATLDVESTGVNVEEDRIIEIALVIHDIEDPLNPKEIMAYTKRINPERNIPQASINVHGITNADVMKSPTFKEVAEGIWKLLQRVKLVIGHNIEGFDMQIILHELIRAGVDVDPANLPAVFDTMLKGRWASDDGKIPSLKELCYALDVEYDDAQAHAALYDVRVNAEAFLKGLALGAFDVPSSENQEGS